MDNQENFIGVALVPGYGPIPITDGLIEQALTVYFGFFTLTGRANGAHIISNGSGDTPQELALREALPEGFRLEQFLVSTRPADEGETATVVTFSAASTEGLIGGTYPNIEAACEGARNRDQNLLPQEQNIEA